MKERELKVELLKAGKPNDTVFVLGATGCGKTTLIANLARERKRFIIIDTKDDFPPSFFPDAVIVDSLPYLRSVLNSGRDRIIVQLWKFNQDIDTAFADVCAMQYDFHLRNAHIEGLETTFLLDETNAFCYVNRCPQSFGDIIQRGRGVGIRKIFGAQWFGTIPIWARETFTEIYTFRHSDEVGLDRLEQYGFDRDEVTSLPDFTCLYAGKGKHEKISLIPTRTRQETTTKT